LNVADFEPEAFDFKVRCLNHWSPSSHD